MRDYGYKYGVAKNDVPGITTSPSKEMRWLYSEWDNMLMRCYNENYHKTNPAYIGCTVCDEWKYLSNFIRDAKSLPGWSDVVAHNYRGMSLDKDGLIVGNREYSKYACQWVTRGHNSHESIVRNGSPSLNPIVAKKIGMSLGIEVVGIDPQGNIYEWYGTTEAGRQLGVSASSIQQACNGGVYRKGVWEPLPHTKKQGKFKGWSFYWKDEYNSIFSKVKGGQVL